MSLAETLSPAPATAGEVLLSAEGVSVEIEGRRILDNVGLSVRAGRVTGLIGHNGSGKSTLVKLLARQAEPSAGRVLLRGAPIAGLGAKAFARSVAFLQQTPPRVPGLTVRELVGFGRFPWHGALGRITALDRRKIEDGMAATQVQGFADRDVETLSGGERQRAWIAMLVAQDAECLLLDEPISALDLSHQAEVLGLLRRLARERNVAVAVVIHDLNMAIGFCDEIVALKGGRAIRSGPPADLMRAETLAEIFGVELEIFRDPRSGRQVAYLP